MLFLFLYLLGSVASPETVVSCASGVVAQLQGHFIIDEVTITEFEDPQIVEHVAMVTLSNVEFNKKKDHVSNLTIYINAIYFTLVVKIF